MLLMHSGIGPAAQLQSHSISVIHALEGVGQNLQDHTIVPLRYLTTEPVSLLRAKSPANIARYLLQRRGMLASSGVEVLAHVRSRREEAAPDLQVLLMAVLWMEQGLVEPKEHGFTIGAAALKPKSRGEILLRSNDSLAPPRIQPNYCSDEAGDDLRVLREGIRMGRRIVVAGPFGRLRGAELTPGAEVESDSELTSYIRRETQTYYHPVGTCRMGSDAMAVVDPDLRVRGIERLRVADASIMPTIPRANTNAATIMIGEKAAHLIQGKQG